MNFGDWRVESLIREEEQRSTEDNASIVPGLQGCDQYCLLADGMRVLLDLEKGQNLLTTTSSK